MKSIIAAGLMATLAVASLASAKADVIFSITQIGPTIVGPNTQSNATTAPYTTSLQLVVTDAAAANGFSFNIPLASTPNYNPQINGLQSILLQLFDGNRTEFSYTLDDFLDRSPSFEIRTLTLTATAGGLLSGNVYGNDTALDTRLFLDGTSAVTGIVNSDRATALCSGNNCSYTAVQTRTAVPEPMSLAIFGAGLAGLAMVRRRKA